MLNLYNNKCKLCPLYKDARSVCVPGRGKIPARVLFLGESPGEEEDKNNEVFVGRTGDLLTSILANTSIGSINYYITNAVKCHPLANAKPDIGIIETCSQKYLRQELKIIKPELIICLGKIAAMALLQDTKIKVGEKRETIFYTDKPLYTGIPFIVTYHPAATFHQPELLEDIVKDFEWAMELLEKGIVKKKKTSKKYQYIESIGDIPGIEEDIKWIDLDSETTGKDFFLPKKEILSIQISIDPNTGYYLDWNDKVKNELRAFLKVKSGIGINGYNVKHDLKALRILGGIRFEGRVNDACNDVHLWNENLLGKKDLDSAAKEILGEKGHKEELKKLIEAYVKTHKRHKERIRDARERLYGRAFKALPLDIRVRYGCGDADKCGQIRRVLRPKLKELGLLPLQKLMNNMVHVYTDMECNGVKIDESIVDQMDIVYTNKINKLRDRLDSIAPWKMNHNSPQQLAELIFRKWKLEGHEVKTGKKRTKWTTAKENLQLMIQDDIDPEHREYLEKILEFKKLGKLHGTYIRGLPRFLRDGYIHANWNMTGADSGRTSCNDPNLQQIPRDGELKQIFRSRWKNGLLVGFDCSQGELRIAAHVANEQTLIRLFNSGVADIHRASAAELLDVDMSEVTEDQRYGAKQCNFAKLFGSGIKTIAQEMIKHGISYNDAVRFVKSWEKQFSGWGRHVKRRERDIIDNNYIRNLFGRYRNLFILDPESDEGRKQLRIGINAEIQGSLSDFNKLCGHRIWKRTKGLGLFILEVHDQWLMDVRHEKYLPEIVGIVKEEYEQCDTSEFGFKFKVPMLVDVKVGPNWKEMEKWTVN